MYLLRSSSLKNVELLADVGGVDRHLFPRISDALNETSKLFHDGVQAAGADYRRVFVVRRLGDRRWRPR